MYKIRILIVTLFLSLSGNAQNLPDSIVIVKNTYTYNWGYELLGQSPDSLIDNSQKTVLTDKRQIKNLSEELNKLDDKDNLLSKFGIDTTYIKHNPDKLLKLYKNGYKIKWNSQQKEYIFKILSEIENYKKTLSDYLSIGNSYGMHTFYKYEFDISLYKNGELLNTYLSRKYTARYKMPYTDKKGNFIYNYIDKFLQKSFYEKNKIDKPLQGKKLLKYLVNKIIDYEEISLYELTPYSYQTEINELQSDFQIVSFEEVYGIGRYIWDEPKTMKITLKTDEMLPNVYLQFLASQVGNSIYSR
ncbi:MAG: hypothetical protein LBV75_00770, partial [Paludibacter sp.]|nr:hypothetical protein [Paludibacter sp.]